MVFNNARCQPPQILDTKRGAADIQVVYMTEVFCHRKEELFLEAYDKRNAL